LEDILSISIKFCGGVKQVTGSMHLLTIDKFKLLIDCGLFQGHRKEFYAVNSNFCFDPKTLSSVIVSHAHIDHSGNIPNLVKCGLNAPIFITPPTKELCNYMLPDSGHIQEEDAKYINKKNKKAKAVPLYTEEDARKSLEYFRTLEYHKKFSIAENIDLTFLDAGHVLGSAIPVLDIKTNNKNIRIAYAVDLGKTDIPLMRDPEIPKDIDYLIIESTYGARSQDDISVAEKELTDAINRTVERKGKIVIPSFALERAQLIIYFINDLIKRKKIENIPIFVDSPLTVNITKVFRENWQYLDDNVKKLFLKNEDPFGYDNVTYINEVEESKKLNEFKKPCIIISASGMCENGRILHHLKNNIEDKNNTVIIVGFMAQNTLGRAIVDRKEEVKIYGKPYKLKAEVVTLNAFSAHADKDGLLDYVKSCKGKLKKVFIVHGELEQSEALYSNIKKIGFNALIPDKNEEIIL
jgi:metallo-beta-lactamase family protein